jgi:hypothetical protein
MAAKGAHVLKSISGGWGVQKSGAERATKVFDSQERAIEHGRALAKREGTSLYIHREDGTIKSVASGALSHSPAPVRARSSKGSVGHATGEKPSPTRSASLSIKGHHKKK